MCTVNKNNMMNGSWDMEYNRDNFFSFWTIFLPFYPTNSPKIKIWKKWKELLEISSFYTSVPKIMIIYYTVPEIWHMADVVFIFHFGLFFPLFFSYPPHPPPSPPQPKKIKIKKKWKKKLGDMINLQMRTKYYDQMM